jgi:hypothetical protein
MERTNREIQEVRTQRRITGHHRFDDKNASATDISSKAFKQLAPTPFISRLSNDRLKSKRHKNQRLSKGARNKYQHFATFPYRSDAAMHRLSIAH